MSRKSNKRYGSNSIDISGDDANQFDDCDNLAEKLNRLEVLAKDHVKIPLKK